MIDFRPALFVIGLLLMTLAFAMLAPFAIDVIEGHPDWQVFASAGMLTMFVGGVLVLTNRAPPHFHPAGLCPDHGELAGADHVCGPALRLLGP